MGLILIIIPFMSMNIEQVQTAIEQTEIGFTTEGYVTINPLGSYSYNLGYLHSGYHDLVDWQFDSEDKPLKVMLMTEYNYQRYLDGLGYTSIILSEGLFEDEGLFVIQSSNYYRVIFRNTAILSSTYAYIYAYKDWVEAEISANIDEKDSDYDGYKDKVEIDYTISLNYYLPSSVQIEYSIKITKSGLTIVSESLYTSTATSKSFTYVLNDELDEGESAIYVVSIIVFYENTVGSGDDSFYQTSEYVYPIGHKQYLEDKAEEERIEARNYKIKIICAFSIPPIAVIAIIVSVIVIVKKRKKRRQPITQTHFTQPQEIIEEIPKIFCIRCGAQNKEMAQFCIECGSTIKNPEK